MKTVYSVAFEDEGGGGVNCFLSIADAQAYYDKRVGDLIEGCYITLYAVEVEDNATDDEIVDACDHAMWECEDSYRSALQRINLIPAGAKHGPDFLRS